MGNFLIKNFVIILSSVSEDTNYSLKVVSYFLHCLRFLPFFIPMCRFVLVLIFHLGVFIQVPSNSRTGTVINQ